jgi:heme O synthase-like polyprenyltransferase
VGPVLELSKPRITQLVVLTAAAGYYLGSQGAFRLGVFAATLAGTALVAAGTNAFNMVRERDVDARMQRTRNRPLPAGRVSPRAAIIFAAAAATVGIGLLAWRVNLVTAASRRSLVATSGSTHRSAAQHAEHFGGRGAGRAPVLGGGPRRAADSTRRVRAVLDAVSLAAPHFLALAWIYREDYRTAQLRMLSVEDDNGRRTAQMALLYAWHCCR